MLRSSPAARAVAAALAAVVAAPGTAAAQTTATQNLSFEVQAISQISVGGSPSPLVVSTATTGSAPNSAATTGAWSVTTNESNKKVTAQLDVAMPSGLTLTADLTAPSGATSTGATTLTTSAANVVTGISGVSASGLSIVYTLSATAAASPTGATARTVTYTLVTGP
jgi:hypothetical protein